VALVVSCHAWNKDFTQVALSPNNEEIWVYETSGEDVKKWNKTHTLTEHGGWVSALDWCPSSNRIVSCGHDRNAYVWRYDEKTKQWKPTLVVLRINRAATCVKWSPAGNKFAVGSGAKTVAICQYEEGNDWWISKMIKKHASTVLSLSWCCNNKFIVTGSCDSKCRVFSAWIKELDHAEDDGFGEVWPKQHTFGELLAEFDAGAWVNSVAWSPNAFRIAFTTHASTISFVQILLGSNPIVQTVNLKGLPFLATNFLSDDAVVAVGFDNTPHLFVNASPSAAEPSWAFSDILDKDDKKGAGGASTAGGVAPSATKSALKTFQDATARGIGPASASSASQKKETSAPAAPDKVFRHTNAISCIFARSSTDGKAETTFWTSGLDGRVLFWDLKKIGVNVPSHAPK